MKYRIGPSPFELLPEEVIEMARASGPEDWLYDDESMVYSLKKHALVQLRPDVKDLDYKPFSVLYHLCYGSQPVAEAYSRSSTSKYRPWLDLYPFDLSIEKVGEDTELRAAEKRASREKDASDLAEGRKTREELRAERSAFAMPHAKILFKAENKEETKQPLQLRSPLHRQGDYIQVLGFDIFKGPIKLVMTKKTDDKIEDKDEIEDADKNPLLRRFGVNLLVFPICLYLFAIYPFYLCFAFLYDIIVNYKLRGH